MRRTPYSTSVPQDKNLIRIYKKSFRISLFFHSPGMKNKRILLKKKHSRRSKWIAYYRTPAFRAANL